MRTRSSVHTARIEFCLVGPSYRPVPRRALTGAVWRPLLEASNKRRKEKAARRLTPPNTCDREHQDTRVKNHLDSYSLRCRSIRPLFSLWSPVQAYCVFIFYLSVFFPRIGQGRPHTRGHAHTHTAAARANHVHQTTTTTYLTNISCSPTFLDISHISPLFLLSTPQHRSHPTRVFTPCSAASPRSGTRAAARRRP